MLEQWIEPVCRTAGWHAPAPDARGHYHFRLDGGSRVDASSPDGRTLLLSADLGRLAPGSGGDALLRKVGLAALARAATATGVVSLDTRRAPCATMPGICWASCAHRNASGPATFSGRIGLLGRPVQECLIYLYPGGLGR
jgi:hypothetical protein